MTMSATQCTELLKSLMVAGLLFVCLVWSFPKAVIHSPLKLQGLNFPILEQYHNKGDPTGFLIWTTCKPIKTRNGSHRKCFQGTTENGTNSDRILHQTSGGKVTNTKNTLFIVRKLTLLLIVLSYDYIGVLNCMAYKWLTLWCTLWSIYSSSIWLGEALLLVLGSWLPSDSHWQANPAWDLVAMDVMSHLGYLMMSPWEQWPWQWDMDRHHFQVTWWHHRSRSHIWVTQLMSPWQQ